MLISIDKLDDYEGAMLAAEVRDPDTNVLYARQGLPLTYNMIRALRRFHRKNPRLVGVEILYSSEVA